MRADLNIKASTGNKKLKNYYMGLDENYPMIRMSMAQALEFVLILN